MRSRLPILTYHSFDNSGGVLATEPARFQDAMAMLCDAGFRSIDLCEWIEAGRPPVERSFAICIDDGLCSILNVLDVLERFALRSTVFLVSGWMGRDNDWPGQPGWVPRMRLLNWSDLAMLKDAGVRFGAHTRTHPDLRRLDSRRIEDEIRGSRDEIEARTGAACRLLAYPYGAVNDRVRRGAARHVTAAFGTRLGYASREDDPHEIARIDAFYLRTDSALRALIEGRLGPRLRVRRAARCVRGMMTTALGG